MNISNYHWLMFILVVLCLNHCSINTVERIKIHGVKYILDIDYGNSRYVK
jgi:hypothetical protein